LYFNNVNKEVDHMTVPKYTGFSALDEAIRKAKLRKEEQGRSSLFGKPALDADGASVISGSSGNPGGGPGDDRSRGDSATDPAARSRRSSFSASSAGGSGPRDLDSSSDAGEASAPDLISKVDFNHSLLGRDKVKHLSHHEMLQIRVWLDENRQSLETFKGNYTIPSADPSGAHFFDKRAASEGILHERLARGPLNTSIDKLDVALNKYLIEYNANKKTDGDGYHSKTVSGWLYSLISNYISELEKEYKSKKGMKEIGSMVNQFVQKIKDTEVPASVEFAQPRKKPEEAFRDYKEKYVRGAGWVIHKQPRGAFTATGGIPHVLPGGVISDYVRSEAPEHKVKGPGKYNPASGQKAPPPIPKW
jgi:hypothetical protein